MQADRCLQERPIKCFAKHAAEFTIHANVDFGLRKLGYLLELGVERENQIDFTTECFKQATDFRQIRWHIERAIHRPDDVDLGLFALSTRLDFGRLFSAVLAP